MLSKYRRQIRKDRRKNDDVPLSAFADIAFLLIIFFILTTTFVKTKGMTTEIPAGEKSEQAEDKTPTILLKGEQIFFNDQRMSNFEHLRKELAALELNSRTNEEDRILLLEADADVMYQNYYQTMVTISRSGGLVSIIREEKKDQ